MGKRKIRWLLIVLFVVIIAAACDSQGDQVSDQRNRPQPPSEFKNLENTYSTNEANIAEGKDTYLNYCLSCHGENGMGDGVLSGSLDPKPVPFPLDNVDDSYLYWRISEGGLREPFNSVMPAWKTILSEEEIWDVILYLRSF